jgi:hypothetical protein
MAWCSIRRQLVGIRHHGTLVHQLRAASQSAETLLAGARRNSWRALGQAMLSLCRQALTTWGYATTRVLFGLTLRCELVHRVGSEDVELACLLQRAPNCFVSCALHCWLQQKRSLPSCSCKQHAASPSGSQRLECM